jgi:regulator of sigma E protease
VIEELVPEGSESLAALPRGVQLRRVGEKEIGKWGDFTLGLIQAEPGNLLLRYENPTGNLHLVIPSDPDDRARMAASVVPWVDATVGAVDPGSPAERGGVEAGDEIRTVDGVPIVNWFDFLEAIHDKPEVRIELGLLREGRELVRAVTLESQEVEDPETGETISRGRIGIYRIPDEFFYTRVGLAEAVSVGYRETVAVTGLILDFLKRLVTGNISPRSVGSIVTIGEASGQAASQGLDFFLRFMALFSVNLAILNLLPIPVLDGGHLIFLAIEAVRGGNPLSVEQRLRWSQVGFVVLLGIMVWALSNDFMRLFGL